MPVIVIAALLNPLKPSITAMRCFTLRWSCSIRFVQIFRRAQLRLLREQAIGFQLAHRTVRCSVAVQRDRLRAALLALDRFKKNALAAATSRLTLSLVGKADLKAAVRVTPINLVVALG
jgi:hypothetical protein